MVLDLHRPALNWLSWIRIRFGNADPDPGALKLTKINIWTWFPACQNGICTVVGMFIDLHITGPSSSIFHVKFLLFVTLGSERIRIRIGLAHWIRIRIELKRWIRIRSKFHWKLSSLAGSSAVPKIWIKFPCVWLLFWSLLRLQLVSVALRLPVPNSVLWKRTWNRRNRNFLPCGTGTGTVIE